MLAVLVERRGADRLKLTASQRRLDDRRRVDRALGRSCAHERVHLIDEQDDVAALPDLLHHLLETLLELASVLRAGDERGQIERVELLASQGLRYLVGGDLLRESLDDGRLADARLADEHGVVLRPARQDLHHALDLVLASDHGIELALASGAGEVATELIEHLGAAAAAATLLAAGLPALFAVVPGQQLDDRRTHLLEVGPEVEKDLRGHTLALADEPEQDVLGAYVVVSELEGLAQGQLEHLLRSGRERDVAGRDVGAATDELLDLLVDVLERDGQRLEGLGGDAVLLADQPEQEVLGADVVLVEHARLFLGVDDHPARLLCEPLEHVPQSPYRIRFFAEARSVEHGRLSQADGPPVRDYKYTRRNDTHAPDATVRSE
jgi:hypothetical protein